MHSSRERRRWAEMIAEMTDRELEKRLPDQRFGGEVSVWWVIVWGNLDHETHHRGQIATYLRALAADC
ncbi:MAG: DinB family protein [Thermoanaerobaculia bacterium]